MKCYIFVPQLESMFNFAYKFCVCIVIYWSKSNR